jgi:histidinol-phosphate/aromatic aminotransferase/cobyric acid decarboxylase-like protein
VVPALAGKGIMIAPVGGPPFENHIRITLGTPEDTDAVLAALKQVL